MTKRSEINLSIDNLLCPICAASDIVKDEQNQYHEWLGYTYQCQVCKVKFNLRIWEDAHE